MSDNGLDSVLSRVKHWMDPEEEGEEESDPTTDLPTDGGAPPELPEAAEGEELSPADFLMETGMSREEYIQREIHRRGGCVRQRELYECLDRSDSSVSRLLSRMEEAGVVDRYFVDGEKVVTLPDGDDA